MTGQTDSEHCYSSPRLLDLCCGAGGATKGYQTAGFYVVGVDVRPQPNYCGDEFHQADALAFPLEGFDGYHASPPCQFKTAYRRRPGHVRDRPNLIPAIRDRLSAMGRPYVIENVEVGVWRIPLDVQRRAMGIDWMTLQELSEAIPPLYAAHIGRYLCEQAVYARSCRI